MALTTWDEQQAYRDYLASLAYNGARSASSLHRIGSKGTGETRIAKPIQFACTFVEEPTFTSGVSLTSGALIPGAYPIATCGVYKWQTDKRGFYIGAYIWVAVNFGKTELDVAQTYQQATARLSLAQAQLQLEAARQAQNAAPGSSNATAYLASLSAIKRAQALLGIQLTHHLRFEALALRDVNIDDALAG